MTALIGFHNKGQAAFTVQSIEGSLRHLQDFGFFIQNVCCLDRALLCLMLRSSLSR